MGRQEKHKEAKKRKDRQCQRGMYPNREGNEVAWAQEAPILFKDWFKDTRMASWTTSKRSYSDSADDVGC